jgi:hypothetical protein
VSAPATGCQADAERRLLGDGQARWLELRVRLGEGEKEARNRLERDPVFQALNTRWRGCMMQAGVDARDPIQLARSLPVSIDIRTNAATRADVHCKAATGYLAAAYSRLAAMQQAWLDRNPRLRTDREMLLRRQDAAARDVFTQAGRTSPSAVRPAEQQ